MMNKTFHANRIRFNACVGFNGNFDIDAYAFGYSEAEKILVDETKKGNTTIDAIVYPILFCARHFIELTLKHQLSILSNINQIVNPTFRYKVENKHSISWLWAEFKRLSTIDTRYEDLVRESDEYIQDFSEIDDNGETFRYPYSTDNNKHLGLLHCIDIIDFHLRFHKLNQVLKQIVILTDLLIDEYRQKSFICKKSRFEIEHIARRLPPFDTWPNKSFKKIKDDIKRDFYLTSNQLSKIISFIKSHREFSLIIDKEIKILELNLEDLKWFLDVYDDFLKKRKGSWHFTQDTIDKVTGKLRKKSIAAIVQLYEIGYFNLYSEEYDYGFRNKMRETKSELVRVHLLANGIVKEKLKIGLQATGQKTLLQAIS
jgi:hypothetical protein